MPQVVGGEAHVAVAHEEEFVPRLPESEGEVVHLRVEAHLRAARSLADHLGTIVHRADRPPLATPREETTWARVRRLYELTSRLSQAPVVGPVLRPVLNALTFIDHLHPYRDQSRPVRSVRTLDRMVESRRGRCKLVNFRAPRPPLRAPSRTPAFLRGLHADCAFRGS